MAIEPEMAFWMSKSGSGINTYSDCSAHLTQVQRIHINLLIFKVNTQISPAR